MARESKSSSEKAPPEATDADHASEAARNDPAGAAPDAAPDPAPESAAAGGADDAGGNDAPGDPAAEAGAAGLDRPAGASADDGAGSTPAVARDGDAPARSAPEEPPPAARPAAARPPSAAAVPPSGSGGGFLAGLIGGALAVAGGVGLLWLSNPDLITGQFPEPDLSPLETRIEAQAAAVEALTADLARLRSEAGDQAAGPGASAEALAALGKELSGRIDALSAEVAGLSARLEVLDGRIAQVEARPPVMGGDAASENAEALAELRAALEAQRAEFDGLFAEARQKIDAAAEEAARLRTEAEAAARTTVARAAFSRLSAALESGGPFSGALSELTEVVGVPVPPELIAVADTGVPTLGDLVRTFPDAARAALAAAIRAGVDAEAGAMERLGAFLRAQTGARSITPREGGDPDAVLSRAEAALGEGRLDDALALIDMLPEPARLEMAGWRAAAERRRAALAAAAALSATLPAN